MSLLWKYIVSHLKTFIVLTLFAFVFAGVFLLFGLPAQAVMYAAAICVTLGIPVLAYDFYSYIKRHKALLQVLQSESTEEIVLPESRSAIENDYAALVRRLCREAAERRSEYDRKATEAQDYYTLWAHQIKTPIAAMSVLLQQDAGTEASAIRGELFKIERYVELVLQYLRLDSISSDMKLAPVNLCEAVRSSVKKYAALFIRSHLTLRADSAELDVEVVSDEKWLCFMIEQIISNAIKYTPDGGVVIYARGRSLYIEDTGIGISPEDLPRIFERGFTGYNGRMDKKSTGLGLYLCARVAEKLSITLDAESAPGRGTKIILTFPESADPE